MEDFQKIQLLGQEREDHLEAAKQTQVEIAGLVPGARREGYTMEAIARAAGVTRAIVYLWVRQQEPTN